MTTMGMYSRKTHSTHACIILLHDTKINNDKQGGSASKLQQPPLLCDDTT
jgi:hypothetical protein